MSWLTKITNSSMSDSSVPRLSDRAMRFLPLWLIEMLPFACAKREYVRREHPALWDQITQGGRYVR